MFEFGTEAVGAAESYLGFEIGDNLASLGFSAVVAGVVIFALHRLFGTGERLGKHYVDKKIQEDRERDY